VTWNCEIGQKDENSRGGMTTLMRRRGLGKTIDTTVRRLSSDAGRKGQDDEDEEAANGTEDAARNPLEEDRIAKTGYTIHPP